MWKKIALIQLILLVALVAFWAGKETKASVEPSVRELTTSNEDGNMVYIWNYDSGSKEWDVRQLDFSKAYSQEVTIPASKRLK